MHELPFLIARELCAAVVLFALTWVATRRSVWWIKAAVAVLVWSVMAVVEAFYWGILDIDYCYPRPAAPPLVPAHIIFAALWLVVVAALVCRRIPSKTSGRTAFAFSVLLIAAGVVAVQWPREAEMSYVCETHLRNQWLALQRYAKDHGGRLPPTPGTQWAGATSPYYTYRSDLLKCPMDRSYSETSYLLLPEVAGRPIDKLRGPVILLLENKPRHHGKAHALLGNGEVVDMSRESTRTAK